MEIAANYSLHHYMPFLAVRRQGKLKTNEYSFHNRLVKIIKGAFYINYIDL